MRCKLFDFVILLAVLVTGTNSLQGGDWPMYRADAARTGYSSEPLPDNLELRWIYRNRTAPMPAWPDSSRITFDFAYQPIIVDNTVIFGSSAEDKVVAIDTDSGKLRWTFFTGGPVRFAPVAWHDRIFVASDDGHIYAIKTDDGTLLWKHRGGLNERMCMGNERMISRWPARGGPVAMDNIVYYAAGIWPSDGIFLHALDARTGIVLWTNDSTGRMYMPQPHGGANAHSGVTPQGYLLATNDRLFVPTGRAVPAAFRRSDGQFEYYRLQQNGSIGGARALLADRFVINAGCFLTRENGDLAARAGRGVFGASPDGILRSTGKKLLAYRWANIEKTDRKGNLVRYRGLEKYREIVLEDESKERRHAENVIKKMPALGDLYRMEVRFSEEYENVSKQTGLERTLTQARPDIETLGFEVGPFLATTYERRYEVISAAGEAVCGGPDIVRVVNLDNSRLRWSHEIEGNALGLAAGNGLLVVSTSNGVIYCFGSSKGYQSQSAYPVRKESSPAIQSSDIDYAKAAEEILDSARIKSGICIDLGCGTGELALELVKQSQLYVIGIDSNPAKVNRARRMLDDAGIYGSRVTIHLGDPHKTPYPRNCANLIVSSQSLAGKQESLDKAEIERLQRPYGGVVCLGTPGQLQVRRRGPMKGAGQWTHQNCDAANTLCSPDKLAKGPLEMAWYRDGVIEIADRHAQAPAPLCNSGYLVVEGVDGICAVDAYNGHTLWTYPIPGILADWDGVHHDVGVGDTGSNFCLSDDAVFVRIGERCLKIELATGRKINEFKTPVNISAQDCNWGYIAYADGLLFGSVLNNEHTISPRYEGIRLRNESVLFFALDADTGRLKWKYQPQYSVRNNTIAIAGGRVYLIDRPIALADRITDPKPNRKHLPLLKPGEHPGGTLIAMDARTGLILWRNDHDVFGTQVAVSDKHNALLMYYQAVKHNFFKLPSEIGGRMAAFDVKTGTRLWDNKVEHKSRPMINEDVIYAEGGAWKLKTGEPVPWNFKRSYGCGQIAGSTNMLVFRSATLGYLDLRRNAGTENFGGIRPSCWFNAIVAGGLVLVPDGSSKCACSYQMRSWVALQQKQ
ncbi:MAG: PQQ-binding-like beta-propeller repeat protein [Planctomycetes bacterium]|nr:PQQ-binding-like beta-propeller repeat protein [Planctomycetota bacterium]MBL7146216.1 PQQ-binding-like beta-propeller repeat protein [Phycisphaerae bacterium]